MNKTISALKARMPNFERLAIAYAIIDGIPDKNLDLESTFTKIERSISNDVPLPTCGAIACAAGWLSLHPDFKKDFKNLVSRWEWTNWDLWIGTLSRVFNLPDGDIQDLFGPRGNSSLDLELGAHTLEYFTDKQLWLSRVRVFLDDRDDGFGFAYL